MKGLNTQIAYTLQVVAISWLCFVRCVFLCLSVRVCMCLVCVCVTDLTEPFRVRGTITCSWKQQDFSFKVSRLRVGAPFCYVFVCLFVCAECMLTE